MANVSGVPRGETLSVGSLLFDARRTVLEELLERLALAGFTDIPLEASGLFRHIDLDGSLKSDLAVLVEGDIEALVAKLDDLGYARSEGDRVQFTDRGRQAVETGQKALAELERAWAERVGEERFETFREVLEELRG